LLTPRQPASDATNCSTFNPSVTTTSTDAAAPGSQRGPEKGSIPVRPFAAFSSPSASEPPNTTRPYNGRVLDPTYVHTSTLTAAMGTSEKSRRPTPRLAGVAEKRRGHRERDVDVRTVVGSGADVGVTTTTAVVVDTVACFPPDEHPAKPTSKPHTPKHQSRRRTTRAV